MGEQLLGDRLVSLPVVRPDFESRPADWLGVEEALARILSAARPLEVEHVDLGSALGRGLAEEVLAQATLPPWTNSAVDGYAVRGEDVRGANPSSSIPLRVVASLRAGDDPRKAVSRGEAIRIMTGAPVPPGADSVVRVEDTDREDAEEGVVRIVDDRDAGQNLRAAGQDMRQGERLMPPGHSITPGSIGVLAAAGCGTVAVHRQPTVAILTTGDELRGLDRFEDVRAGRGVPNSNAPMIAAMSRAAGAKVLHLGNSADDTDDLRGRIEQASSADVLVTLGGASMGEADLVKRVLDGMGYQPDFWRIRVRPGSPAGFGHLPCGGKLQPTFTLPGNPTSAFVTFEVFVRPFLRRLGGHEAVARPVVVCRAAEVIRAPARLTYFLRVNLEGTGSSLAAHLTGPQGSGLVSGLARARGLAIVPEDVSEVAGGGEIQVMLIEA